MPVLAPRALRALGRIGKVIRHVKADATNACWNWALTAYRNDGISPNPFFDYIRGLATWADLGNIPNIVGGRLIAEQVALNGFHTAWTTGNGGHSYEDAPQNQAKSAAIIAMTRGVVECMARINGLQVSGPATDYQLCMHFPAIRRVEDMVPRRSGVPFNALDVQEFLRGLGPNYQHWWLRIGGRTTVETFPGNQYTQIIPYSDPNLPNGEQPHEYYQVARVYLAGLHQEHVTEIITAIQRSKVNHPPFTPYAARQPWQPDNDAAAARCNWCSKDFGFLRRRHHCRRCGLIFCDDCSSQRDNVNLPATRPGEAAAAAANNARVCMTCYTQNN